MSGSEENKHFSDGMTEDILLQLSEIGDLKVISRQSVMRYKDADMAMREIAEELGASHVVEGSVRRAEDDVRITAQLIDARSDEQVWGRQYDRELSAEAIFHIQSEIGREIARELRATLSPELQGRLSSAATEVLTAYDYFLEGREYQRRGTREDYERAIAHFRQALVLDPDFALAHAELSFAYTALVGATAAPRHWLDSAEIAARTALDHAASWTDELYSRAERIPATHELYLAVTPLRFMRDGLALHRGAAGNEPLEAPWDDMDMDDERVIQAFADHVENMIAIFDPDYLAYGIEVNMLAEAAPHVWPAFVTFAREVYGRIKAEHGALPVFLTLQADFFHADRTAQTAAIDQILRYTDYIAVSTYPFTDGTTQDADSSSLRADHFSALHALAPDKPFAVAETAWPAEDVTAPYPATIHASETTQHDYVAWLLNQMDGRNARFINWFFTRDYDDFWESTFRHASEAPILRIWKDTGMYDGAGRARPALTVWRERLLRPRNDPQ